MTSTRAATLLRRLARHAPAERRELHRLARMPDKRGYSDEVARWAVADLVTAAQMARDVVRYPDILDPRYVAGRLRSAAVFATAAAVCAMVDAP